VISSLIFKLEKYRQKVEKKENEVYFERFLSPEMTPLARFRRPTPIGCEIRGGLHKTSTLSPYYCHLMLNPYWDACL
jgi:hypothetical protein